MRREPQNKLVRGREGHVKPEEARRRLVYLVCLRQQRVREILWKEMGSHNGREQSQEGQKKK